MSKEEITPEFKADVHAWMQAKLDEQYLAEIASTHPRFDFAGHGLTPDEYDVAMRDDSFDVLPRWNEV